MSPAKDLDGFDACGILLGYKKCAFTDKGMPKIYGVVEKTHISRVYYRYVDVSNVHSAADFREAVFGFLGETVDYFQPKLKVYNDDGNYNLYIKQLNAPKVYGITKEALSTLKCEFRLAKENSEAVSIDSKTGKTVKNNTKGNISVSPDGTLTIKSTEKETYVVECIITADHYKTLAKSIYIYVE